MTRAKLSTEDIASDWRDAVSVQDYSGADGIEGVRFVELRELVDDGGSFLEVARLDEAGQLLGVEDFQVRQVNFSTLLPGAVKAWHVHFNQEDVWFIPPISRLLVGLKDIREDSATKGNDLRFVLGPARSRLLVIPRGVAHGCANLTTTPQHPHKLHRPTSTLCDRAEDGAGPVERTLGSADDARSAHIT